jgi:flagellar hook-associated protein 1 FlgK
MTFNAALSNALSGMTAAQTAVQLRSHNVANAGTPGYVRRDVALEARAPSGGVLVTGVVEASAGRTLALALGADALAGETAARAEAAGALNLLLGEPGDDRGLYAATTRFETALADLAATPESQSYQQALLTASKDLAGTFARIGDEAQAMRAEADAGIADGVAAVNRALTELDALNDRRPEGMLSTLPERRQALIDEVAGYLDIRVRTDGRGRVSIATASGVPLLGDEPRLLQFRPAGTVAAGNTVASGHLSGLSAGGIELTPGQGPQAIGTGGLAGLFAVRDEAAPAFASRLDAAAEDLAARLAAVDSDGAGGLLQTTGGPGAASRMTVSAAADPAQGGALFRLRDGLAAATPGPSAAAGVLPALRAALGTGALSVSGGLEALSSSVGTERLQADRAADAASATRQSLRDEMLVKTGVNTDRELQSLLLIEQAYAANARVVQVVSDMIARLMEL